MYWSALSTALWPWKLRKPAGVPKALTDATNGTRLQLSKMVQAVSAWTVRLVSCAKICLPGLWGSGYQ